MSENEETGVVRVICPRRRDVDPWAELRGKRGVTIKSEARLDA